METYPDTVVAAVLHEWFTDADCYVPEAEAVVEALRSAGFLLNAEERLDVLMALRYCASERMVDLYNGIDEMGTTFDCAQFRDRCAAIAAKIEVPVAP